MSDHANDPKSVQRLDKVLASAGIGSRKDVRRIIRSGRVSVSGERVDDPTRGIIPAEVVVAVDGTPIRTGPITVMLNKPSGLVTATKDPGHRTVLELFPPALARRLFPAGRLDKDTEGLLILTDDGQLCHRLISPNHGVEKEYVASLDGSLSPEVIERFAEGIVLKDGYTTRPARLRAIDSGPPGIASVTIAEGKYHQVKRMFAANGLRVTSLKRLRIGALRLPEELPSGKYRHLTPAEVDQLFEPAES